MKLIYILLLAIVLMFCLSIFRYGLDKIESQGQEIAKLKTKVMWLENFDKYMLAVEAMPEMERDELKAVNELIKQKKLKK